MFYRLCCDRLMPRQHHLYSDKYLKSLYVSLCPDQKSNLMFFVLFFFMPGLNLYFEFGPPLGGWGLISVAQLADEWAERLLFFIRSILSSSSSSWSGASNPVLFSSLSESAEDTLCPCFTPPSCHAACRILPFNSHLYSRPLRLFVPRRSVCAAVCSKPYSIHLFAFCVFER